MKDKSYEGFTEEERDAMKERASELKAAKRRGKVEDEEGTVLAKIAEFSGPDRAMAERIHAIVKANAEAHGGDSTLGARHPSAVLLTLPKEGRARPPAGMRLEGKPWKPT